VAFLVSSSIHCYTNNKLYFTTDTNSLGVTASNIAATGAADTATGATTTAAASTDTTASSPTTSISDDDGSKSMRDWVNALPLNAQEEGKGNVTWACAGERVALAKAVADGTGPHMYCDGALTDRAIAAATPS